MIYKNVEAYKWKLENVASEFIGCVFLPIIRIVEQYFKYMAAITF